ncbi:alpha carbonic anhydrase 7 [Cryptomeria japonica]|uniref:alpha carbonic anhydrase 7 n=1 Tax=Cryptomeria japonica TaxID=3369 RepID=UPI0027DA2752|nr:alpha carbonic anhydrase 7 [Cryptomeria japonica]
MSVLSLLVLLCYALFITTTTSIQQNNLNYLRTTVMRNRYSDEGNETETRWDYGCDSGVGPSEWGEQSPKWVLCSKGAEQSPIRILSFDVAKDRHTTYLETMYHPASATFIHDGNLVKLKWKGGFLYIDGILYELYETRFHTPSEHSINGKIYPLEMQMMHRDLNNGGMVILAILFEIDDKINKFLDQLGIVSGSSRYSATNKWCIFAAGEFLHG